MNRVFNKFNAFIVLLLVLWLFTSCDATKRVKADEYLLTKTSINVDGKKTNSETLNSFLTQKENARFLGVPFKLYFYNIARPNLDSILNERIYNNPKKVARKTKILSRKQLDKQVASQLAFNQLIKKT